MQSNSDYNDHHFQDITMDAAQIYASEFHACTFNKCTFVEATFTECRFVECHFEACDFSLTQFPQCLFSGISFKESKLIGINWTLANWFTARLHAPLKFNKCILNHSTFIGLELNRLHLHDCTAVDVDFREASLIRASFTNTDLQESLFLNTNLTHADLSRAQNYQIKPMQNIILNAKFSLPEAIALLRGLEITLID